MQDVSVSDGIHRQHEELASLERQTNDKREALCVLSARYDSVQQEMERLLEAVDKRHQLLRSLDSQLDSAITAWRRDIEVQFIVMTSYIHHLYLLVCLAGLSVYV